MKVRTLYSVVLRKYYLPPLYGLAGGIHMSAYFAFSHTPRTYNLAIMNMLERSQHPSSDFFLLGSLQDPSFAKIPRKLPKLYILSA